MAEKQWTQKDFYREKRIESLREFDEYDAHSPHAVYRGQANEAWRLWTGYERVQWRQNPMRELEMIRNFSSQAGVYASDLPSRTDYVSWLALMQHHGTGTRLLDVTSSRYVALFFAIMGMYEHNRTAGNGEYGWDGAVWIFKTYGPNINFYNKLLGNEHTGCIDLRAVPFAQPLAEYKECGWRFANQFIVSDACEQGIALEDELVQPCVRQMDSFLKSGGIVELVPQKMNARMIAQSAEFLMPITLRIPFEGNLMAWANLFPSKESFSIEKLVIPRRLLPEIWEKLDEMNINHQTLFPDLTGLAKRVNFLRF